MRLLEKEKKLEFELKRNSITLKDVKTFRNNKRRKDSEKLNRILKTFIEKTVATDKLSYSNNPSAGNGSIYNTLGAGTGSRTRTAFAIRPSNVRVSQFRHPGTVKRCQYL